nr:DUF5710 domain-containing protein [uncultured Rhodoferax sp.]
MRINLVTPFAEKDAVKALGARWDATKKLWYIVDVVDLTPFLRWIPDLGAATVEATQGKSLLNMQPETVLVKRSVGVITTSTVKALSCDCPVHAWEECPHSSRV